MSTDCGIVSRFCGSQNLYSQCGSPEERRFIDHYLEKSERVLLESERKMNEIKPPTSSCKRKVNPKSVDQNNENNKSSSENGAPVGGKRAVDITNSSSPPKKGKLPVDELSLAVGQDDLVHYGDHDQGYIGLSYLERLTRAIDQTAERNVTYQELNVYSDSVG